MQSLPKEHTAALPIVALYQPDIPGNTGTILRSAACLGMQVHIIEPAGFRIDDKSLLRAGMDYLDMAQLHRHDDWDAFCSWCLAEERRLILLTTKSEKSYTGFAFDAKDCLLFGRESAGVPESVHEYCAERLTIPIAIPGRSLNLAVSVAMVAGEAIRQFG